MEKAMLKNMLSKTGRPLSEWIEILKKQTILEKKELTNFLKNKHSVGHFYAQLIFKEFNKS